VTPDERKRYLWMASRHARRGSGSGSAVLRERSEVYGSPNLDFLKARVDFVVVGGLATRLYMPERMTLDTDILVLAMDVPAAEQALEGAGGAKEGALAIGGSTWRMPEGRTLDLITLDAPWTEDAVRNPVEGEDDLPYIALPYLVLMKLASGRLQDLADIGRMLGAAGDETIEGVRKVVSQYRPEDVDDLESIVRLGKLEYGQSQAGND